MIKILLIEDNEENRDMLGRRLQRQGFAVCCAVDGPMGVAMAVQEAPDLILMDIALGDMDGWEATQRIKSNPGTAQEQPGHGGDPDHRPHRARAGDRPGKKLRGRVCRVRHEAGRSAAPAREDTRVLGRVGSCRPG